MKKFLRLISLILVVAMLFSVPSVSAAQKEEASTNSLYFVCYDTYLYKLTISKIAICFDVTAKDYMDELGVSSIKIQRSADGTTWSTMKTYTPENYSQMIADDTYSHADYVTYSGSIGYYYRAYVIFYAKKGTGTGKVADYTPVIQITAE